MFYFLGNCFSFGLANGKISRRDKMSGDEGNPHFTTYRRWLGYVLVVVGSSMWIFWDHAKLGPAVIGLGFLLVVAHRKK